MSRSLLPHLAWQGRRALAAGPGHVELGCRANWSSLHRRGRGLSWSGRRIGRRRSSSTGRVEAGQTWEARTAADDPCCRRAPVPSSAAPPSQAAAGSLRHAPRHVRRCRWLASSAGAKREEFRQVILLQGGVRGALVLGWSCGCLCACCWGVEKWSCGGLNRVGRRTGRS